MRYFTQTTIKLNTFLILFLTFIHWDASAQNGFTYEEFHTKSAPIATIPLDDGQPQMDVSLQSATKIMPLPLSALASKKVNLDNQRLDYINQHQNSKILKKKTSYKPILLQSFLANSTQSTPNDNDIAVSNGNMVMSVLNTNVGVFNDTGKYLFSRNLSSVAKSLKNLTRTYDPRVLYDPTQDRFILVFLQGSSSADTRICVGFSKSNDPTKDWTFYQLPGNIWGDSSWSDYPIISINQNDLFITVNRLKDNTYWKNGFIESVIWQVDKINGFKGDTLNQKAYYNIKYKDRSIWSICPARQGNQQLDAYMNFVSLRPEDEKNDTVFIHEIMGNVSSGKSFLKSRILKSPQPYGLQPNALMPNGKKLQTNDARVLTALYTNNALYFSGNSIDSATFSPSLFFAYVDGLYTQNPSITSKIIHNDSFDIAYPSIAYTGGGLGNKSIMLTCSYVSQTQFPGTGVYMLDRNLDASEYLIVKRGESVVNLIGDTVERWGDYTGIQEKYNEKGVCWLSGSFGRNNNNLTWIGRIFNSDPGLNIAETEKENYLKVYPNPSSELIELEIPAEKTELVEIYLNDIQGKSTLLLCDKIKFGINRFRMDVQHIPSGIYSISIFGRSGFNYSEKIIVNH